MAYLLTRVTDYVTNTKDKFLSVTEKIKLWLQTLWKAIKADQKGWLICMAVLIITVLRSGITYSFGVFVVKMEDLWKRPLAEHNWVGTLSFTISLSFAPLSVAFIRALRYRGYRWGGIAGTLTLSISCLCSSFVNNLEWMFFTHSLLYGVGSSLIYMASSLVIGEYFDKDHKYHVLATSILLCGYPIGSLLFNPINAWLVTEFGWRTAFRVACAMILVTGIVCSWFFSAKDSPNMTRLDEEEEEPSAVPSPTHELDSLENANPLQKFSRRCCTIAELRERPEIGLWYLGNGLNYLGFFMPFVNLAYYMELHEITTTKASWALTLLSLAECCTYIIASFFGDYLKGKLIHINVIASGALTVICFFWPLIDVNYSTICVLSMAMGGFLGMTIVYTYAASGEVTELPIDIAWSFTNLWSGMGILVGPFFSGVIYDLRKSYDDVFYVVGAIYALETVIFGSIVWLKKRRTDREGTTELHGLVDTNYRQTYKISSMRSVSKGSLANGDLDAVPGYGTTESTLQRRPSGEKAQNTNGQAWQASWPTEQPVADTQPHLQQPQQNPQQHHSWPPEHWQ